MKILLLLLPALALGTALGAANPSAQVWDVVDVPLLSHESIAEPLAVHAGAFFVHGTGQTMKIPAFYDGGKTWVLRFCPPSEGEWTYTTYSSEPSLAGRTGTVLVAPNEDPNEHGPLVIPADNPQRFEYADGTSYFLLAFELDWLFALDAENPNDIPKTRQIISDVKAHGFNQIIMNVYAHDVTWHKSEGMLPEHDYSSPSVFPYGGDNDNPDYSTLNIEFFQRFDRVMRHLDEQNIFSHLMIYVWNKMVNWPEPESAADNLYFDYVVKRYQAFPNLVWDISKEALAYGRDDMGYITRRIERLRKLDGHGRLLTVHDYAYCNAFPEMVDIISKQDWRPNIYNAMREAVDKYPTKPVFNIEHGGYERTDYPVFDGAYNDPYVCLDRNYQCIFAGSYSTYYWQNSSWYNVIPDPFSLPEDEQPAFHYYKHLTDFFARYDFNQLKPDQYTFTPFSLTDGDSVYLFYLMEHALGHYGDVPPLKGKRVEFSWFNPATGEYTQPELREIQGTWIGARRPESITSPSCILIMKVVDAQR